MRMTHLFCQECAEAGVSTLADFLLQAEEDTLEGPALGDPDYWPAAAAERRALCGRHYAQLPADARLDYVRVDNGLNEAV